MNPDLLIVFVSVELFLLFKILKITSSLEGTARNLIIKYVLALVLLNELYHFLTTSY